MDYSGEGGGFHTLIFTWKCVRHYVLILGRGEYAAACVVEYGREMMGFHSQQVTQRQTEVVATPYSVPRQTRECCTEAVAFGLRAIANMSRDMRGYSSVLPAKCKRVGGEEKGREEKRTEKYMKTTKQEKKRSFSFHLEKVEERRWKWSRTRGRAAADTLYTVKPEYAITPSKALFCSRGLPRRLPRPREAVT